MADLANEGGAEGANTMFATVAQKPAAAAYNPCLVLPQNIAKNSSFTFTLEISEKSGNFKRI